MKEWEIALDITDVTSVDAATQDEALEIAEKIFKDEYGDNLFKQFSTAELTVLATRDI